MGHYSPMRAEALHWFVRGIGLGLGVAVIVAMASGILVTTKVLVLVFVSIVLASGLEPIVGWMRARARFGRRRWRQASRH